MKKIIIIAILNLITITFSYSQKVIIMEEYNGVYRIPCSVNGAKMKFVFDTGASTVCLSMAMAEYLLDNDYIKKEDIKGTGTSTVADGRIVNHVVINLNDIEIQGMHLYDVKAVVVEGQKAPLLMGQTAIQKLGAIEINGNKLTIKSGDDDEAFVDRLFEEADQAMVNRLYEKAVDKYSQLYAMDRLSDYGVYRYALACYFNKENEKALEIVTEINDYSYFEKEGIDIYHFMGNLCFSLDKFREASYYYEKSCSKMLSYDKLFGGLKDWALSLYYDKDYNEAFTKFKMTIECYAQIHNVDGQYIINDAFNRLKKKEKSYRNDEIDEIVYYYIHTNHLSGGSSNSDWLYQMTALAKAGNKRAMKLCNEANINPYYSY